MIAVLVVVLGTSAGPGVTRTIGVGIPPDRGRRAGTVRYRLLQGAHGMTGQGFLGRVPLFIGVLTFDDQGKFSGAHDENIGGNIGSAMEAGDYEVRNACRGISRWTDHKHTNVPDHNHTITFVVVDGGKELMFHGIDKRRPARPTPWFPSRTSS